MPAINIDELVEPIGVTVGGKTYTVEDISRETARKMASIKETEDNVDTLTTAMTEVLGAKREDIEKLGMRKLLKLVTMLLNTVNDEVEGKNAPKAVPKK